MYVNSLNNSTFCTVSQDFSSATSATCLHKWRLVIFNGNSRKYGLMVLHSWHLCVTNRDSMIHSKCRHVLRNGWYNQMVIRSVGYLCVLKTGRCRGLLTHDDVIKWKHFPRYWPFVRGIHRSPVNSAHKGQWRGASMFSLICVNGWVNNREAGDLRRHRAHCDVIVMNRFSGRFSEGPFPWLIQKFPCILIFKTGLSGCQLNLSEGQIRLDLTSGRPSA